VAEYLHYFIVFSGETSEGLSSEFYRYNSVTNTWEELGLAGVSGRYGACMALNQNYLFVFGGQSENGQDYDELWLFDFKKENIEKSKARQPPGMKFSRCFAGNNYFTVLTGAKSNGASVSEVWTYYPSEEEWVKLSKETSEYDHSEGAIEQVSEDLFISLGGVYWNFNPNKHIFSFSSENGHWTNIGSLDSYLFSGASAYFGNSIYVHGGGSSVRNIARNQKASGDFFKVSEESWKCSAGTQYQEGCSICPKGTYNPMFGGQCLKCPKGTSSSRLGAVYCFLCPQGSYMDEEGGSLCKDCNHLQSCPLGSTQPNYEAKEQAFSSQQPSEFQSQEAPEIYSFRSQVILFFVFLGLFVVVHYSKRLREVLPYLDMYDENHKHELNQPMILRRTYLGGLFSVLFIVMAALLCLNTVLLFKYENVEELKSLLPLVTVDKEFKANLYVNAYFYNYPGKCLTSDDVELELINLEFSETKVDSNKTNGNCLVSWECKLCKVQSGSSLYMKLAQFNSFSTMIEVEAKADSSIPEEFSSASLSMTPFSSNKVFQGGMASNVTFKMTPSVFKSQVTNEESTGYHITLDSDLDLGSTSDYLSLSISTTVKLMVNFDLENVALMTQRQYKQDYSLLLGSLLGSVFGLMEIIGSVMKLVEGGNDKLLSVFSKRRKLEEISGKRERMTNYLNERSKEDEEEADPTFTRPKHVKISQVIDYSESPKDSIYLIS